jgi:hypothetical protein
VFGILNMLVSVASFAPIIIVGPVADVFGNATVLFLVAIAILVSGILSIIRRGRLRPEETKETSKGPKKPAGLDPVSVSLQADLEVGHRRTRPTTAAAIPEATGDLADTGDSSTEQTAVITGGATTSEPADDDPVINPS